jgi:hypothetical protein
MSEYEILIRIYFSRWTRRLWTLQESALAAQLFIQFADIAIDFTETHKTWRMGYNVVDGKKNYHIFNEPYTPLMRLFVWVKGAT